MEVKILVRSCTEFLLNFVNLALGFLVTERIRECKVCRVAGLSAEHVLEFERELILLVDVIVHLGKDASPFLVGARNHSKDGLEPLTIKLCLIVKVLEGKCQLLSLGNAFNGEVKPGLVTILLVWGTIMGDPKEIFVPLSTFTHSREVSRAEVTIESDHCIPGFLKFLSDTLWMDRP